jgi:hypothetical protein
LSTNGDQTSEANHEKHSGRIAIDSSTEDTERLRRRIAGRERRRQALARRNCMGCHDNSIYTREDRLVQSLDALKKRLGDCSHMANKEFSASETQNIIKYLNDQFYQFR